MQVVLQYYCDRVVQLDVERVASLTPLVHRQLGSLSGGGLAGATQQSSVCSLLALFCCQLSGAVRQSGVELARRRPALLEPLFSLLRDAVDAALTLLSPRASSSLVWSVWQRCRPGLLEQRLQQQVEDVERLLQEKPMQTAGTATVDHQV